ncbi:hypothetical protein AMS68_008021 [Peltaster fructicola]|uniref:Uncharacterized protein n=1 Tax=Peltaster fructicola TaxID=286661 RepID=A0A6H0Y646_9PEZI|nr:hypothetical protein AMS68_008021 [Peltaster fructicola]
MRATLVRLDQYGLQSAGTKGVQPWAMRQPYQQFRSRYGPNVKQAKYKLGQYDVSYLRRIAPIAVGFGAAAGVFAVFFLNAVPRLQRDVLSKIPLIGGFFTHEIAPEDNPF